MLTVANKMKSLFFFHKNIFHKNIEADIGEILRIFQKYTEAEILILFVENL